jgi:uncharacterized protein YdeI (YjbR/CyaY-like superfamily)
MRPFNDPVIEPTFFATPAEFEAWLDEHHATEPEALVGFHKRATGRPSMTWPESVEVALCFGWIDGIRRSVDGDSYTIRFTPRKPGSHWSAVNVAKAQELIAAGRMRPAGRTAFEQRREDRTAQASYERADEARLEPEQERRLRENEAAWAFFGAQPPWYRRTAVHWITSAKRPETRERRLAQLIEDSAAGVWLRSMRGRDRS